MALPALFLAWYVPPLASLHAMFLNLLDLHRAFVCKHPGGAVLVIQRYLLGDMPG